MAGLQQAVVSVLACDVSGFCFCIFQLRRGHLLYHFRRIKRHQHLPLFYDRAPVNKYAFHKATDAWVDLYKLERLHYAGQLHIAAYLPGLQAHGGISRYHGLYFRLLFFFIATRCGYHGGGQYGAQFHFIIHELWYLMVQVKEMVIPM